MNPLNHCFMEMLGHTLMKCFKPVRSTKQDKEKELEK